MPRIASSESETCYMIKILTITPVSACFELDNTAPYYAPQEYTVSLNGEMQFSGKVNVFSVYNLRPGTDYTVSVTYADGGTDTVEFTTKSVSCGLNVRDFGAVGDGVTDDSDAIQTAVHFLPQGGLLHFPAGTYLTRPLALKSHMTLEFAQDAVLLGDPDRSHYQSLPGTAQDIYGGQEVHFGAWEGNAVPMYQALVSAAYAEDITIVGPGTVDGNAQNSDFWVNFDNFPLGRPRLIFFNRCRDIVIHGITAQNSASWQLHPYFSQNVGMYDLLVKAPKNSPNTDAIDPESCAHVDIIGCRFTVGDDCIAIKSGKIDLGRTFKQPADYHTIRNCLMEFGHGAVTLGSEIGAGVTNLAVSQCYFKGTDRGLRIKTRRGRGEDCMLNNILFENIRMDAVLTPIAVNMWYNCCDPDRYSEYVWSRECLPVDERTPHLGKFTFRNMECTDVQVAACYIDGLPEMPIDEVDIQNVRFTYAANAKSGKPIMKNFAEDECRKGMYLDNVRRIVTRNVTLEGNLGPKLIANHYAELDAPEFKEEA